MQPISCDASFLPALLALAGGLAGLVVGGELLVSGAVRLARCLGMSSLLIGLTIVAFGTSMPELFVSLAALLQGRPAVMIGNVVGSNIANVGLILGVAACLVSLPVRFDTVRRELCYVLAASFGLVVLTVAGCFYRAAGAVYVAAIIAYTVWSYRKAAILRRENGEICSPAAGVVVTALVRVFAGLVLLAVGSGYFIDGAVVMARLFGVSELVIGLTLAAVGTSLPELAASISAIRHGQHKLLVGNVIGSNLFNLLMVMGSAALVRPFSLPRDLLYRDLPVMAGFSLALVPMLARDNMLRRWQGAMLLGAYFLYIYSLA